MRSIVVRFAAALGLLTAATAGATPPSLVRQGHGRGQRLTTLSADIRL